jgi:hypothetical protein
MIWIPLSLILLAVVFKLYGKPGLESALLLAGALLIKDAAFHFAGKLGEWLVLAYMQSWQSLFTSSDEKPGRTVHTIRESELDTLTRSREKL